MASSFQDESVLEPVFEWSMLVEVKGKSKQCRNGWLTLVGNRAYWFALKGDEGKKQMNDSAYFSLATRKWRQIRKVPRFVSLKGHSTILVDDKIYIISCVASGESFRISMVAYDIVSEEFLQACNLPLVHCPHARLVAVYDEWTGEIIVCCGNTMYSHSVERNSWTQLKSRSNGPKQRLINPSAMVFKRKMFLITETIPRLWVAEIDKNGTYAWSNVRSISPGETERCGLPMVSTL